MIETGGVEVRTAVVASPQTWGAATTVTEARAAFLDDHVHMLLLTDGDVLVGTVVRDDLLGAPAGDPALRHAVLTGRTVAPDAPAEGVRRAMLDRGERRLAVVDGAGRLVGLLCLKRHGGGFCRDEDVRARRRERHSADVA
ncbi:CBS domain-containing protein [Nocardioides okcheonensis]|uniref:CBS domain-containing protein n=1 Tax=Nocardioides okcheonensis TaxID=2894081 RepID=UPI001E5C81ED|nr:CBS domain-containing protein [Nocardioides okcheonensis]UFN44655.1 CBS domain-containing protein [Nocardioides okcheonensis]